MANAWVYRHVLTGAPRTLPLGYPPSSQRRCRLATGAGLRCFRYRQGRHRLGAGSRQSHAAEQPRLPSGLSPPSTLAAYLPANGSPVDSSLADGLTRPLTPGSRLGWRSSPSPALTLLAGLSKRRDPVAGLSGRRGWGTRWTSVPRRAGAHAAGGGVGLVGGSFPAGQGGHADRFAQHLHRHRAPLRPLCRLAAEFGSTAVTLYLRADHRRWWPRLGKGLGIGVFRRCGVLAGCCRSASFIICLAGWSAACRE